MKTKNSGSGKPPGIPAERLAGIPLFGEVSALEGRFPVREVVGVKNPAAYMR